MPVFIATWGRDCLFRTYYGHGCDMEKKIRVTLRTKKVRNSGTKKDVAIIFVAKFEISALLWLSELVLRSLATLHATSTL